MLELPRWLGLYPTTIFGPSVSSTVEVLKNKKKTSAYEYSEFFFERGYSELNI